MQLIILTTLLVLVAFVRIEANMDEKVYLVDIRVYEVKGKKEGKIVRNIRTIFMDKDVEVLFQFKELGNPNIVTILKVNSDCTWADIAARMYEEGVRFTSTPLISCYNFAKELGMVMPGLATDFGNGSVEIARLSFTAWGFTFDEYSETMTDHLQITRKMITELGMTINCYKYLSGVPEKMIYFMLVPPSHCYGVMRMFQGVDRFTMTTATARDIKHYRNLCS